MRVCLFDHTTLLEPGHRPVRHDAVVGNARAAKRRRHHVLEKQASTRRQRREGT